MKDEGFKRRLLVDWGILDKDEYLTKQMIERCIKSEGDIFQNMANAISVTLKYMNYQGSVLDQQDFMDLVGDATARWVQTFQEEINKEDDEDNHEPYKS